MPNVAAAEWFLSLFTAPDRASAIAGDLAEQRGSFWFNALRTAGALMLKSAAARPWRFFGVFLLGLVLRELALFVPSILFRLGWVGLWKMVVTPWNRVVAPALMPALIGYVVARLARGREIAACLAVAIFEFASVCFFYFRYLPDPYAFIRVWLLIHSAAWGLVVICSGALTRKLRHAH